jgi:hypothetical protein
MSSTFAYLSAGYLLVIYVPELVGNEWCLCTVGCAAVKFASVFIDTFCLAAQGSQPYPTLF